MASAPTSVDAAADSTIFPSSTVQGRFYALGQILAREQQHTAALQAQLDERGREIQRLQTEVQQLRQHERELQTALDHATAAQAEAVAAATRGEKTTRRGGSAGGAGEPAAENPEGAGNEGDRERLATITALRTSLAQEQQRRQAAESELTRLKAETSTPPYADAAQAAADLAAAKKEVADLRTALENERTARADLAQKLQRLERHAAQQTAQAPDTSPADADLRARLQALEAERQAAVDSFNRSLAASQQRAAELERQLAAARAANAAAAAAPAGDATAAGDLTSIREENQALRTRLDEEHRRTEQLAAKLKLATRVTDLIFKMQAQQSGQAPPVQMPRSDPWLDR